MKPPNDTTMAKNNLKSFTVLLFLMMSSREKRRKKINEANQRVFTFKLKPLKFMHQTNLQLEFVIEISSALY